VRQLIKIGLFGVGRDMLKLTRTGLEMSSLLEVAITSQHHCLLNDCHVAAVLGSGSRSPEFGERLPLRITEMDYQHYVGTCSLGAIRKPSQVVLLHVYSGTVACRAV
jgi:hypothetical protein